MSKYVEICRNMSKYEITQSFAMQGLYAVFFKASYSAPKRRGGYLKAGEYDLRIAPLRRIRIVALNSSTETSKPVRKPIRRVFYHRSGARISKGSRSKSQSLVMFG